MFMMSSLRSFILPVALMVAGPAAAADSAGAPDLMLGTGNVTGIYYPVGGAVAALWSAEIDGVEVAVESTGGAIENLARVGAGDLPLGIARSDLLIDALQGPGIFANGEPPVPLRALFALQPEPVTVIARADAGIAGFGDLAGKRLNLGPAGSAGRAMLDLLIEAWGWTEADFAGTDEIAPADQVAALCDDEVDAIAFVSAHPTGTILEALSACDAVLVPVGGEPVDTLTREHSFLATATIPAGLYGEDQQAIPTVGPFALVVASADVPDEMAYRLTRSVFVNLDALRSTHPVLAGISRDMLPVTASGIPVHPGALRYYREAGFREAGAAPDAD